MTSRQMIDLIVKTLDGELLDGPMNYRKPEKKLILPEDTYNYTKKNITIIETTQLELL